MKSDKLFGIRFTTNELAIEVFVGEHFAKIGDNLVDYMQLGVADITEDLIKKGNSQEDIDLILRVVGQKVKDESRDNLADFIRDKSCRHYYITGEVLNMCARLKVKEPFDLAWLKQIPNGIRQLNFGDQFFRYNKEDDYIMVLAGKSGPDRTQAMVIDGSFSAFGLDKTVISDIKTIPKPELYSIFFLNLVTRQADIPKVVEQYNEKDLADVIDFEAKSRKQFFQLISFMELAPIEEIILPVGAKHGTRKSPDNLLNEQKFPITIVNKGWNRSITRVGSIDVEGHFRMQAYGPQYSKRKLVFIKPFSYESFPIEARKITITAGLGKKQ